MKNFFTNIKDNIATHKVLAIVMLIGVLIPLSLLLLSTSSNNKSANTPKTQPTQPAHEQHTEGNEESLDSRSGLLRKEPQDDGTIKNFFASAIPNRPNLIVSDKNDEILFQRSVTDPQNPIKITDYTDNYGQAKQILNGSYYYGPGAKTYIYEDLELAFIANPQTGEVYEQHIFPGLSTKEYIEEYGEDIVEK